MQNREISAEDRAFGKHIRFYLGLAAEALAIATIIGTLGATIYNKVVFDSWNISFYQVATVGDIAIYAISLAIDFTIVLIISGLSLLFSLFWIVFTRKIRVELLKGLGKRFILRRFVRFVVNYFANVILSISIFYIINVYIFDVDFEYPFGVINWSWNFIPLIAIVLIYPAFLGILTSKIHRLGYIKAGIVLSLPVISIVLISKLSTESQRWFGFVSDDHVQYLSKSIDGCDKVFVVWMGEENTVLECWRNSKKSDQVLYILDQHGGLIGPVEAEKRDSGNYSRYGPLPLPADRTN